MKKRALRRVFQWRGGRDSNPRLRFKPQHSLSRRAQSATLAPPQMRLFYFTRFIRSGGSGIRTHVGVTQTCFQDMRLRPLGHPSRRGDFTMLAGQSGRKTRPVRGEATFSTSGTAPSVPRFIHWFRFRAITNGCRAWLLSVISTRT